MNTYLQWSHTPRTETNKSESLGIRRALLFDWIASISVKNVRLASHCTAPVTLVEWGVYFYSLACRVKEPPSWMCDLFCTVGTQRFKVSRLVSSAVTLCMVDAIYEHLPRGNRSYMRKCERFSNMLVYCGAVTIKQSERLGVMHRAKY